MAIIALKGKVTSGPRAWMPLWGLALLALLVGVFLAGGGLYRTVKAGDDTIYIVNRFTGGASVVQRGVVSRLKTVKEAKEEEAKRAAEQMIDDAAAAGVGYVADFRTKLYHSAKARDCLEKVAIPDCYGSVLELTNKGFRPCQICLGSRVARVTVSGAPVRWWPRPNGPVDFRLRQGQSVKILGEHGGYCAIATERATNGISTVGWIPAPAVR